MTPHYEVPKPLSEEDPREALKESRRWGTNAVNNAEGDEAKQRAAAIYAQLALACAIEGLAAAILAKGGRDARNDR